MALLLLLLVVSLIGLIEPSLKISLPKNLSDRKIKSSPVVGAFDDDPEASESGRWKKSKHVHIIVPEFDVLLAPSPIPKSPIKFSSQISIHSILKVHPLEGSYASPLHLLRFGTFNELSAFYDNGVQLPTFSTAPLHEIFQFMFSQPDQLEKLKAVYLHDKNLLLDFILKGTLEITETTLSTFIFPILFDDREDKENIFIDIISHLGSSYHCKVSIFLQAVEFKIDVVFSSFVSVLEEDENSVLASVMLFEYNLVEGRIPLLVYAAQNDFEDTIEMILKFDSNELYRLDESGASAFYYAAATGNIYVLDTLKEFHTLGHGIAGTCPLIGAAKNNRDDSLEFFLVHNNPNHFNFSAKDIEETAFAAARFGKSPILKILLKHTDLNIYCHSGCWTLLSVSLQCDQLGFSKRLIESFGYDINFVGEDPINPDGHAIVFLLQKPDTLDFFLKNGANINVRVSASLCQLYTGLEKYISLPEYMELCPNPKIDKILGKYLKI
jgi:ankyrin repeat protein